MLIPKTKNSITITICWFFFRIADSNRHFCLDEINVTKLYIALCISNKNISLWWKINSMHVKDYRVNSFAFKQKITLAEKIFNIIYANLCRKGVNRFYASTGSGHIHTTIFTRCYSSSNIKMCVFSMYIFFFIVLSREPAIERWRRIYSTSKT